MNGEELETLCRGIYQETAAQEAIAAARDQHGKGFEILMGPPLASPEIAFIGYQPGEWTMSVSDARAAGYESDWVTDTCQYATADWPLAKRLRRMFTTERLERCVGLNAIFVRAKSVAEYQKIPRELRKRIRTFCLGKIEQMIHAIRPRKIVVIGFGTMRLLGRSRPSHTTAGKVLVREGEVFGRKAFSTPHLSAAWGLRNEDLDDIARIILA